MKKVLLFIIVLCVSIVAQHGERRYFEIPDFNGGINVQSDSANLKPNEALVLDNLIFDNYGSLRKRYGYQYWDSLQLPSGDTIKDIHYLFRSKGSDQLLIGTNNYIYVSPFGDTITSASSWEGVRMGYSRGCIDTYPFTAAETLMVYGDTTWWLLGIKVGDFIDVNDSLYEIDSILADTCLRVKARIDTLVIAEAGDSVDMSYKIYRTLVGDPYITSWNSNAYIADESSPAFVYEDSQTIWLSFIDSGTVDTVWYAADSTFYVADSGYIRVHVIQDWAGRPFHFANHITLYPGDNTFWSELKDSLDAGRRYQVTHTGFASPANPEPIDYTRTIVWPYIRDGDTIEVVGVFWLSDGEDWLSYPSWSRAGYNDSTYLVQDLQFLGSDSTIVIDESKSWSDVSDVVSNRYVNYFVINGKEPHRFHRIMGHFDDFLEMDADGSDTTFWPDDRYYIFSSIPYDDVVDTIESPKLEQIIFHRNVLFAYGHELDSDGDTVRQGFVYHSDIGLPRLTQNVGELGGLYGFDLSLNSQDKITAMFKLYDDLIITTNDKFFKLMGWPDALGMGSLVEIMSGMGLSSHNSFVKRDNNYAYIAKKDGFYIFNGSSVKKISRNIDPLIDRYYTNDLKVGYYDENVYFSFIDSSYTFIYHEPTQTFAKFDFGMSVFNNQATTIDSSYFLFSHHAIDPRKVYKYPTSVYTDNPDDSTSNNISFTYETGWMIEPFGGLQWEKDFEYFYIPISKTSDTLTIGFKVDFDTTTKQTITVSEAGAEQYGYKIIDTGYLTSLKGRALKIRLNGTSSSAITIGRWGLKYRPSSDF